MTSAKPATTETVAGEFCPLTVALPVQLNVAVPEDACSSTISTRLSLASNNSRRYACVSFEFNSCDAASTSAKSLVRNRACVALPGSTNNGILESVSAGVAGLLS